MNFLINQNNVLKSSRFARIFLSSLAVSPIPSTSNGQHERNFTPFDPFQFFNECNEFTQSTIIQTKIVHAQLLKTATLQSDIFLANSLLDWYCKSSAMFYALKLFDTSSNPNVISCNIMISGYNHNFLFKESWRFFCRVWTSGFQPNEYTYGSVLSACSELHSPALGKQVYSVAMKNGFFSNGYVRSGLIDMFAKNYSFEDALRVFNDVVCERNIVCWNAIMSGAVRNAENWVALDLFRQMCHQFLFPNSFTFSSILTACASLDELETGKGVQGWVIKCAAEDVFVGTALVDLYAKCGHMDEAVKEFSCMPICNVVSWTAIISGFVQKDNSFAALKTFNKMRNIGVEANRYTVTSVLTACAKPVMFKEATQVHSWILKIGFGLDPVVGGALINMYSKIGALDLSQIVFREVKHISNPSIWTAMISSFAQSQSSQSAIEMLQRMLREGIRPENFCLSSVLSVINHLELGKQMHCYCLKAGFIFDLSVGSSLFTMYSKCGSLLDSVKVFEQMPVRDVVSLASMITGFAEHGCAVQAVELFRELLSEGLRPDKMTLIPILSTCYAFSSLMRGKEIHGYVLRAGIDKETLIGSSLITMYWKCGASDLSRRVFDMLPHKDEVSWSSLLSGYAQNGSIEEAMLLFQEMLISLFEIDSHALSSIFRAIAHLNRSEIGTQLHTYVIKIGLDTEVSVGSSLVTMYSKCGSIEDCHKAFDQIDEPDLIGWTVMITSYAQHGKGAEALRVYELMRRKGVMPDAVTFVVVLTSCSHNGLIEEGYFHFNSMVKDYKIKPSCRHYACMVDLLGRSGRLREAEKFINSMPIEPDALVWGTLLAACKVHGEIQLGRLAARKVMEMEPGDTGAYVSLSNICADIGQWEEVVKIRSEMKGTGARKEPGWSFA